jgi:hypothetical protein
MAIIYSLVYNFTFSFHNMFRPIGHHQVNATHHTKYAGRYCVQIKYIKKLHGLSPRANYTDRAIAACWRSDCQLLRIEGATWSA